VVRLAVVGTKHFEQEARNMDLGIGIRRSSVIARALMIARLGLALADRRQANHERPERPIVTPWSREHVLRFNHRGNSSRFQCDIDGGSQKS
jgi:hypothetical protein